MTDPKGRTHMKWSNPQAPADAGPGVLGIVAKS